MHIFFTLFSPVDVFKALKNTKTGKASGVDGLATEHFIYANPIIHVYLSLLFNYFISLCYLTRNFMKIAIIPIIKNIAIDSSDKSNYRPNNCLFKDILNLCLGNA